MSAFGTRVAVEGPTGALKFKAAVAAHELMVKLVALATKIDAEFGNVGGRL